MPTYIELKSVKYIDRIVQYAGVLLGIEFNRTGENKYMCRCPFHYDRRDSFSVYVNKKDEVRFHCFGACDRECARYNTGQPTSEICRTPVQIFL